MTALLFITPLLLLIEQSNSIDQNKENLDKKNLYIGYWRFVEDDFKKRHRLWPNWLIKKAMKTRLYLSEDTFIQYKGPNEYHLKPKKIVEIKEIKDNHWTFKRKDANKEVTFSLSKEGDVWIYREEKKEYELKKDTKEQHLIWKNNEK